MGKDGTGLHVPGMPDTPLKSNSEGGTKSQHMRSTVSTFGAGGMKSQNSLHEESTYSDPAAISVD
eukprot:225033-Rhodomonas_salina.14